MSATQRLSLTNHLATASTVTASTEATGFPATNVKDATRPRLTWRSTVTTASTVVIDLGSAKLIELVVLGDLNVTSASVQLDNDSGFGGGDVVDTGALPGMARNEWAGRGRVTHALVVSQTKQWLRLTLPTQTPITGEAFFEVGYLWAGPLTAIPSALFLYNSIRLETVRPRSDRRNMADGLSRLRTGPAFARVTGQRMARVDSPETNLTALREWATLERQWWEAPSQAGAFWLNYGAAADAWVMRVRDPEPWALESIPKSTSPIVLEEFIRGE